MFQDDLAKALNGVDDSRGIRETASAFASSVEGRLDGNATGLAAVHAGIIAVVSIAARHAKPRLSKMAELEAEIAALKAAQEVQDAAVKAVVTEESP